MSNLFNDLVSKYSTMLVELPKPPTREEIFLSTIFIKNLVDLCETSESILLSLPNEKKVIDNGYVKLCRIFLKGYYNDNFFIEDENVGILPNWKNINNFNYDKLYFLCRVYATVKLNLDKHPKLSVALENRNKSYFLNNFDYLFENLPIKDYIVNVKKFIADDDFCSQEDQESIWEFYDTIFDLFNNKDEYIKDLQCN